MYYPAKTFKDPRSIGTHPRHTSKLLTELEFTVPRKKSLKTVPITPSVARVTNALLYGGIPALCSAIRPVVASHSALAKNARPRRPRVARGGGGCQGKNFLTNQKSTYVDTWICINIHSRAYLYPPPREITVCRCVDVSFFFPTTCSVSIVWHPYILWDTIGHRWCMMME